MFKNVASKFRVFAFDATTGLPKTGDAANITASVSKDFGAFADLADTSATEEDSTKAKGYYLFDAAQSETNADDIAVTGRSSTSNVVVVGAPARIATIPNSWTIPRVTLTDTLTTYTGDTPQTGDSFARIGAAGASLTALGDARIAHLDADVSSRAAAATALSTVQWTNTRAGYLDNLSGGAVMLASSYTAPLTAAGTRSAVGLASANLDTQLAGIDADVLTRSTYAGADTAGTTTLLARLTSGRASNLDNLDAAISTRSVYAGGAVAWLGNSRPEAKPAAVLIGAVLWPTFVTYLAVNDFQSLSRRI